MQADAFYKDAHKYIFEAINQLFHSTPPQPIDLLTVSAQLKRNGNLELSNKLLEVTNDDMLFYKTNNLINRTSKIEILKIFLKNIEYHKYDENLNSLLLPIFTPISVYHNNDPKIIWFEFDELNKLEEWVSTTLEKPFILHSVNSSKHIDSKITLNDDFIRKYDSIYDYYDLPKLTKTII